MREVVNAAGTVQQVTNYYPFGATYFDDSAVKASDYQPYKFNGKEFDKMNGLNTYDYVARQHDPILARWDRIDPLAEKNPGITPYHFCHNNPINRVDPDGKDDYYTRDGNYLGTNSAETDNIYIAEKDQYRKIDDGKYEINISSRVALDKTELDANAYSNIFTNVLSQMEGEDKVDNLYNNKVSVGVTFCDEDIKSQFNSPVLQERDNALTEHIGTSIKVSAKVNYGGNGDNRFLFSTVSNIQNLLGIHEYKGHGVNRWGNANKKHYDVYMLQMKHPTWKKTTKEFKQTQIENSKQYK